MTFLSRLFHRADPRTALAPLYAACVAEGRQPHWYLEGQVPDTLDGRFDMIAAVTSLVLLRLADCDAKQESVWLTEVFVSDMDGQLRQIGIGDVVVGKHIGRMMSALGGRIAAYQAGMAAGGDLPGALVRNLYRGEAPDEAALAHVAERLRALRGDLDAVALPALIAGGLRP
ncbi:ubiquinol-cytochrome C chaperone family protein [Sphingobium aquiterrae]|uniref:ubiquinol-cytochrome C chaperone family protein n=1 Tax=Sphingobium aquiterrae TaxID=2038656 RepID=UPI00301ADD9E